jgi:hypothetical protein
MEASPDPGPGGSRLKFNTSTLTLIVCFIAAIGVLYLLGLQNKPRIVSASETQRQQEMAKRFDELLYNADRDGFKGLDNSTRNMVAILMKFLNQSPQTDELDNPFEREVPVVVVTPGAPEPRPLPPSLDPDVRLAQQEFQGLRLQIVMMGPEPKAMINNVVLQPGSKLKYLVVKEIRPGTVVLNFTDKDGKDYEFLLHSSPQGGSR